MIPILPILQGLTSSEADITTFNAVGNLLLYVPLGAALVWRFGLSASRGVAIALALSIAVESAQAVALGRSFDVDDVLLDTVGALVGALVMRFALARIAALRIDPLPRPPVTTPS